MPLGKLSKKQLKKAFEVLTELQDSISASGDKSSIQKILGLTNQFYTLIPHSFGIENPPLLNDLDTIKVIIFRCNFYLERSTYNN